MPNPGYTNPVRFLRELRSPVPDPLQHAAPLIALTDPSAAAARQAVRGAHGGVLTPRELEELLLVVTEAVGNAYRHGRGTVRFLLWSGADRVVAAVSDGGHGPQDTFAGLLPARHEGGGGFGLWLTHLFCDYVALDRRADGFTLRMTAGNPFWN